MICICYTPACRVRTKTSKCAPVYRHIFIEIFKHYPSVERHARAHFSMGFRGSFLKWFCGRLTMNTTFNLYICDVLIYSSELLEVKQPCFYNFDFEMPDILAANGWWRLILDGCVHYILFFLLENISFLYSGGQPQVSDSFENMNWKEISSPRAHESASWIPIFEYNGFIKNELKITVYIKQPVFKLDCKTA